MYALAMHCNVPASPVKDTGYIANSVEHGSGIFFIPRFGYIYFHIKPRTSGQQIRRRKACHPKRLAQKIS